MHAQTMSQLKDCDHVTLFLDETADISNRSGLSLMARIVKDGVFKNLFLDLLQLRRCDITFIFEIRGNFLENENINIKIQFFWDGWMFNDVRRSQWSKAIFPGCHATFYIHPL